MNLQESNFTFFQGFVRVVVAHLSRNSIKLLIVQRGASKRTYFKADFLEFSFLSNVVTHKL